MVKQSESDKVLKHIDGEEAPGLPSQSQDATNDNATQSTSSGVRSLNIVSDPDLGSGYSYDIWINSGSAAMQQSMELNPTSSMDPLSLCRRSEHLEPFSDEREYVGEKWKMQGFKGNAQQNQGSASNFSNNFPHPGSLLLSTTHSMSKPVQPNPTTSEMSTKILRENEYANSTFEMEQLTKQQQEYQRGMQLQQWQRQQYLQRQQTRQQIQQGLPGKQQQQEWVGAKRKMQEHPGNAQQNKSSASNFSTEIHHPGSQLVSTRQSMSKPLQSYTTANTSTTRILGGNEYENRAFEVERLKWHRQEPQQEIQSQHWQQPPEQMLQRHLERLGKQRQIEWLVARRKKQQHRGNTQQNRGSDSNFGMEIHHPGSMLVSMRQNMSKPLQQNPTENTSVARILRGNEYASPEFEVERLKRQRQEPQQEELWQQQQYLQQQQTSIQHAAMGSMGLQNILGENEFLNSQTHEQGLEQQHQLQQQSQPEMPHQQLPPSQEVTPGYISENRSGNNLDAFRERAGEIVAEHPHMIQAARETVGPFPENSLGEIEYRNLEIQDQGLSGLRRRQQLQQQQHKISQQQLHQLRGMQQSLQDRQQLHQQPQPQQHVPARPINLSTVREASGPDRFAIFDALRTEWRLKRISSADFLGHIEPFFTEHPQLFQAIAEMVYREP